VTPYFPNRPEGLLNAPLAHTAQVLLMLLITSGVSTLLITLGHAHLQGQGGSEGRHATNQTKWGD